MPTIKIINLTKRLADTTDHMWQHLPACPPSTAGARDNLESRVMARSCTLLNTSGGKPEVTGVWVLGVVWEGPPGHWRWSIQFVAEAGKWWLTDSFCGPSKGLLMCHLDRQEQNSIAEENLQGSPWENVSLSFIYSTHTYCFSNSGQFWVLFNFKKLSPIQECVFWGGVESTAGHHQHISDAGCRGCELSSVKGGI